jgi:hypothetical protein
MEIQRACISPGCHGRAELGLEHCHGHRNPLGVTHEELASMSHEDAKVQLVSASAPPPTPPAKMQFCEYEKCQQPVTRHLRGDPKRPLARFCRIQCNWSAVKERKKANASLVVSPAKPAVPPKPPPVALSLSPESPPVVATPPSRPEALQLPAPAAPTPWTPPTLEEDLHQVAQAGLDLHSTMRMMPDAAAVTFEVQVRRDGRVLLGLPTFHRSARPDQEVPCRPPRQIPTPRRPLHRPTRRPRGRS